jgi:hypothetical protein
MRFRTKFGALGYCWVGLACLWTLLWLCGPHQNRAGLFTFTSALIASLQILNHTFIYWELQADSLRERRLWRAKEVAWQEITHVGPWANNSEYLIVDHVRAAPLSARGSIIANPEDRSAFLDALHRYAPQATFDL